MDSVERFGANVRKARLAHGWTQEELAECRIIRRRHDPAVLPYPELVDQQAHPVRAELVVAVEFTTIFVASWDAYSVAHHDARRVTEPHCVEAARGRYMCAYTAVTPAGRECHLMQASWTPTAASTITVTLSGRTHRCDSLRAAIRSLP